MPKNPTFFAGQYRAVSYAYGCVPDIPGLEVDNPSGSTTGASQTLNVAFGTVALQDGTLISPLATTAPVTVGTGSNADTVTPSAVSNNTPQIYQSSSFTATTFSHSHGTGDLVASGTVGLQEALNAASAAGGGIVIVDAGWYKAGGTAAILAAATVPSKVSIWDTSSGYGTIQSVTVPLTLAQIQNAYTTSVPVIPAPGAGNLVDVIDATVNLIFGTNAFTTGGAAQLSYGTSTTYPATATVAASVYTGLAANTIVKVAGVEAAVTSSDYLNKAVNYTNATAAFAAGTGCSGNLIVNYRIIGGLA